MTPEYSNESNRVTNFFNVTTALDSVLYHIIIKLDFEEKF